MIFKTRNLRWYQYPILAVALVGAVALKVPGMAWIALRRQLG